VGSEVRVWLCGQLRIEIEGERVEGRLTRRKSRELLALLAVSRGAISRGELIEMLWPEQPPGSRTVSFRQLLTDLRHCLGAETIEGLSEISLKLPEGSWLDTAAAGAALAECREAIAREDWPCARERAAFAAGLLDEEFLASEQADWVLTRRLELEQLGLQALEALGIASLAEPGYELDAEAAGRQLTERSPFRETGYTLLMRALVARGNTAEALLEYERLRVLLRDELGTCPSLGTSALHVWALAQASPIEDDSLGPGEGQDASEPGGGWDGSEPGASRSERLRPVSAYAIRHDGVSIAYQVLGDGPVDLVVVPGFMSHLDNWWTFPEYRHWFRRLSRFARLITLDKAGTGSSDPVDHVPTVDEWADDVLTVLDAVGCGQVVLLGMSEAGPVTMSLAERHPDRVLGLILYAAVARVTPAPHYLWEHREEIAAVWARFSEVEVTGWGHGALVDKVAPSLAQSEAGRRAWAIFERASGSPASIARRTAALAELDACELLARVRVPTLVLHRANDGLVLVHHGRFIAAAIPGAEYVELPGRDHPPPMGTPEEVEALDAEIERFTQQLADRSASADSVVGGATA
jgi:pimeloyl-ACP methyl ester carboxylesterase/DNA-binding SARP family transcriptional activator